MSQKGKSGSSRRKGDEYQDLTALRFALEAYIANQPFEMFLEYEKVGNLDDIVLCKDSEVHAYQVKYAVSQHAAYGVSEFSDTNSPVWFGKFAASWQTVKSQFPRHKVTACLCSNRVLDTTLTGLVTTDGQFIPELIENRKRGEAKDVRKKLRSVSGLDEDLFVVFLANFQFVLRQPMLDELELFIQTSLLDQKLGISDTAVVIELKEAFKQNAINSREPITNETIDNLLERLQSKLLFPQIFPVNYDHFVEPQSLSEQLNQLLPQIDGEYVIVTGLPGSGKSTALTAYFDRVRKKQFEVFRYYCFVGVNDNAQRMRVQAESLRANLLREFQQRYPDLLERRFDYSESNFIGCLEKLGNYFTERGSRFIVLLDGLDHAERLQPEVRDTVISALPAKIPKGVIVVIGTQELHKWPYFLKQANECPNRHIQMPLFTEAETEDYLENKRQISGLSRSDIDSIHKKSEGLPLYLRYAAEVILSNESVSTAVSSLAAAPGGDIRKYYDYLWEEFERSGMAYSKHLCASMACLRFSVHQDELFNIQQSLKRPEFEESFKHISHLLRNSDERLTIFHNSFREFVVTQLSAGWIKDIRKQISHFLKSNKGSPRWYSYAFEYSFDTEDYEYILQEVNVEFVDNALLHCRPSQDIMDAINLALKSAYKAQDIIQLARLGPLKFRTYERLEHNLDRILLAKALLNLGRKQDVMSFAFSPETNHWLVENSVSLAVIYRLAEHKELELGNQLFDIFTSEFRGTGFGGGGESKSQIIGIAKCLGIFWENLARPLQWIAQFNFDQDVLEREESFAPAYAPHLESYIDVLIQFGMERKWKRLKRLRKLFPNNLTRYLIIRALAHHDHLEELKVAIYEYCEQEQPSSNPELAYFAAKAGMPHSVVSTIAGIIKAPITECPKYVHRKDPLFWQYAYSFIVAAYEDNEESISSLESNIGSGRTLWIAALRHLLKACHCIGQALRSKKIDWYDEARQSISILVEAQQGEGERITESIDLIRAVLPLSIGLLTKHVEECYPDRLGEWVSSLDSLRESILWTTHFGINEYIRDYQFELKLWETIADRPAARPWLDQILRNCAATYEKTVNLKGGSRSIHFIYLSTIMAKCGFRNDAEKWLRYGIRSTLIYGYHKDITLLYLIDILNLVNERQPEMALKRCARVLAMDDWMPELTDGRETQSITEEAFNAVLHLNRRAAFDLLLHFSKTKPQWKVQHCLSNFISNASDGDPEFLWCLTEYFSNQSGTPGQYCNQIIRVKQHVVDMVKKSSSDEMRSEFEERLKHFILTEISPMNWPEHLRSEQTISDIPNRERRKDILSSRETNSEFALDGKTISKDSLAEKLRVSFSEFLQILDRLESQNEHFYERALLDSAVHHHITVAKSSDDLLPIKEFAETKGIWQSAKILEYMAQRFQLFGDRENAIFCYGLAYSCIGDWHAWKTSRKYLDAVVTSDRDSVRSFIINKCYNSSNGSHAGNEIPAFAAEGLDVLDETCQLEQVFDNYLTHCESMFEQLPQNNDYAWLEDYSDSNDDTK